MKVNEISLATQCGKRLKTKDIDRVFVSEINELLQSKNVSVKQLSELMFADKATLDTNFKLQRGLMYGKAAVIYSILVDDKRFLSKKSLTAYEKAVIDNFYKSFSLAFSRNKLTYLKAEEIYGISHSTLFCYNNGKKNPTLKNAVVVSNLMKFDLSFDFFKLIDSQLSF